MLERDLCMLCEELADQSGDGVESAMYNILL